MNSEWTLPEDGDIDQVAVRAAIEGDLPCTCRKPCSHRKISLTRGERMVAAALMAAAGAAPSAIATRLHMALQQAILIVDCARRAA